MQIFKNGFFKRCTSVALTGSMAVGMMAVMTGAPAMAANGVACTPGVVGSNTAACTALLGATVAGVTGNGAITAQTGSILFNSPLVPDQVSGFKVLTAVSAARNSTTGWSLTAQETPATFTGGAATTSMVLDSAQPVSAACAAVSTCTGAVSILVANDTTNPDGFDLTTAGGTLLAASTGTGATTAHGIWNVYAMGTIAVPLDAAGTLVPNLTITLAYGPVA